MDYVNLLPALNVTLLTVNLCCVELLLVVQHELTNFIGNLLYGLAKRVLIKRMQCTDKNPVRGLFQNFRVVPNSGLVVNVQDSRTRLTPDLVLLLFTMIFNNSLNRKPNTGITILRYILFFFLHFLSSRVLLYINMWSW